MHNALLMRVVDRPRHRFQQLGGKPRRLWFATGEFSQRLSLDELEGNIGTPVLLADVKDLRNVGMLQPSHHLGLRAKPREMFSPGMVACQNHLQRDQTLEP